MNRRTFLQLTGAVTAGSILTPSLFAEKEKIQLNTETIQITPSVSVEEIKQRRFGPQWISMKKQPPEIGQNIIMLQQRCLNHKIHTFIYVGTVEFIKNNYIRTTVIFQYREDLVKKDYFSVSMLNNLRNMKIPQWAKNVKILGPCYYGCYGLKVGRVFNDRIFWIDNKNGEIPDIIPPYPIWKNPKDEWEK